MDRNDREKRDAAGVGPYAREREHLVPLSSLDSWKVSDGEPDIRGWDVRTVAGRQLGAVRDLLIDSKAGEVVLLDVDLPGADRHTFVPIRVVEIDRGRRVVLMDSADLPDSDLERGEREGEIERRDLEVGRTVRYPRADREVVVERPMLADSAADAMVEPPEAAPLPPPQTAIAENAVDRRVRDRRRIDRLSTDL
jgi:hypothetical protein